MTVYRGIFENNNSKTRRMFFEDSLIRQLWACIGPKLSEKNCFKKNPKEDIIETYKKITYIIKRLGGLDMP